MSVRFNVVLSDELNREIDKAAADSETSKSEGLPKSPSALPRRAGRGANAG